MTQQEHLLGLFKENGNTLTLRQLLGTTLAAEYRARISELRGQGVNIVLTRGAKPSDNTYTLIPKETANVNP